MAQARRGETIFRRQSELDEFGLPQGGEEDPRMENPREVLSDPNKAEPRPNVARGSAVFRTGATPAEQAYLGEIQQPEPTYTRPQLSTKRSVFGRALESLPGTRRIGEELLYGPESRAKEDYSLAIAARQRRLGGMKGAADIEARRQAAENTAIYRGADINYKGARNAREERLLPTRLEVLKSQIGRNQSMGKAQEALAKSRAVASRSPFRTYNPGQGLYNQSTGQISTPANPSAARAARNQAAAGAVTPNQLAGVERNLAANLLKWKQEFDKQAAAIERENLGIKPVLPDGSPNPLYTFNSKMAELNKKDVAQKQMIQRSYEEQLKRLGQNVTPYSYDENAEEATDEPGAPDEQDFSADQADQADMQDEQTTNEEDVPELPIGTPYFNPSTGERIIWDGQKWVAAPKR